MVHVLRLTPISDSISAGSNCLIVWIPRKSPAGLWAVSRTPALVTASSYPSSPSAARSASPRRIALTGNAESPTTLTGNPVGGRINAASISPMARTSGSLVTTTTVARVTSKGAPVPATRDAGAGTTRGPVNTGAGVAGLVVVVAV